jgi:hypothetical protein
MTFSSSLHYVYTTIITTSYKTSFQKELIKTVISQTWLFFNPYKKFFDNLTYLSSNMSLCCCSMCVCVCVWEREREYLKLSQRGRREKCYINLQNYPFTFISIFNINYVKYYVILLKIKEEDILLYGVKYLSNYFCSNSIYDIQYYF